MSSRTRSIRTKHMKLLKILEGMVDGQVVFLVWWIGLRCKSSIYNIYIYIRVLTNTCMIKQWTSRTKNYTFKHIWQRKTGRQRTHWIQQQKQQQQQQQQTQTQIQIQMQIPTSPATSFFCEGYFADCTSQLMRATFLSVGFDPPSCPFVHVLQHLDFTIDQLQISLRCSTSSWLLVGFLLFVAYSRC